MIYDVFWPIEFVRKGIFIIITSFYFTKEKNPVTERYRVFGWAANQSQSKATNSLSGCSAGW